MIYYSLESLQCCKIEGLYDKMASKVIFKNIRKFDKNKEYIIGLQIGFEGDEILDYNNFGSFSI